MKKVALTILFIIILGFVSLSTIQALELDLSFAEPGVADSNIAGYIVRIYQFGVGIAGVLAVGMIVAGAIYYSVSAGNPDKQRDAKGMITGALWGIALLLGSFLILNTINPQIVKLEPPGGSLPECTGSEGERPGRDCLPVPPVAKRACGEGEIPEENDCLPACEGRQEACGIGEEAGDNGCVECTYVIKQCPQEALPPTCPAKIEEVTGTLSSSGVNALLRAPNQLGTLIGGIPDCDTCARDWPTPPGTNPEHGTRWLTIEGFASGTVWQYGAYPEDKGASFGRCIIYSYAKTAQDVENRDYTNSDLDGLKRC